jgi:hypothetical protein
VVTAPQQNTMCEMSSDYLIIQTKPGLTQTKMPLITRVRPHKTTVVHETMVVHDNDTVSWGYCL